MPKLLMDKWYCLKIRCSYSIIIFLKKYPSITATITVLALKGRNSIAQDNALGLRVKNPHPTLPRYAGEG